MENIQEKSPMLIVYQGLKMSETPIEGKKAIGIWVNGVIVFDEAPRKMGYTNAKKYCSNFRKSKPYATMGAKEVWKMLLRDKMREAFNKLCETVGLIPLASDAPYWFDQEPKNCYKAVGADLRIWSVSMGIHPLYRVRPVALYSLQS